MTPAVGRCLTEEPPEKPQLFPFKPLCRISSCLGEGDEMREQDFLEGQVLPQASQPGSNVSRSRTQPTRTVPAPCPPSALGTTPLMLVVCRIKEVMGMEIKTSCPRQAGCFDLRPVGNKPGAELTSPSPSYRCNCFGFGLVSGCSRLRSPGQLVES